MNPAESEGEVDLLKAILQNGLRLISIQGDTDAPLANAVPPSKGGADL